MRLSGPVRRRISSRAGGVAIAALGTVLCGFYASRLLAGEPARPQVVLSGVVVPGVVAVAVTAGGVQSAVGDGNSSRTAGWCLLGAATFWAFARLVLNYQLAANGALVYPGLVLLNAVTGGAGAGLVVGLYDERVRRTTRRLTRRESELERERDRFRALFENLPNPALRFRVEDDDPVVEETNEAFGEVFGYDREAAVGERVRDLIVPAEREDEPANIAAEMQTGEPVREHVRRVTEDGVREFLLIAIPVRLTPGVTTGHAVFIDVTDRERYVQRLEVLNRVLRHDLRNDANVVLGHADILAEKGGETAERAEVIAERAEEMVDRGDRARLMASMLASDAEEGTVSLSALLREQAASLREAHPEADVSVHVDDETAVNGESLLATAFEQLLTNAVEHNDDPEPTVRVDVLGCEDGFVTVAVRDDGPGIPEREREVLRRARETALEHSLGTGLWLARWAVEETGGEVEIEERENGGTTVLVRVPTA